MNEFRMHAESIARLLGQFAYRFGSEKQLHDRLETVLTEAGHKVTREVYLAKTSIVDLMVEPGIAIEVKIHGGMGDALEQCTRYAAFDPVNAVVLASSCAWAGRALSAAVREHGWKGKPFALVHLRRQSL